MIFNSNKFKDNQDFQSLIKIVKESDEQQEVGKVEKIFVKMKNGELKEKKIDTEANMIKAAELKNITIKGRCIDLFKYLASEQPDSGQSDEPQII